MYNIFMLNKCLKRIKRNHIVVNTSKGPEAVICEILRYDDGAVFRLQIGTTYVDFNGENEWDKFLDMVNYLNSGHKTLTLNLQSRDHWHCNDS